MPCVAADAGGVGEILDRDRHAEERRVVDVAARDALLGVARSSSRLVGGDGEVRVELGIEPLDAFEVAVDELAGRHLAVPDHLGLVERAREGEVRVHASPSMVAGRVSAR